MKDKIPFYDIVNKFFVGTVFTLLFTILTFQKLALVETYNKYADILKDWSVIVVAVLLVVMYEIGFIINRGGSAIIAPLLEKTFWKKDKKYDIDVSKIKKTNETFSTMITELVLSRSHILIYLILTPIAFVCGKWQAALLFIAFIALFVFSGMRHNVKINQIRKSEYERKEKEKEKQEAKEIKQYLSLGDGDEK